jgi:hypothetical protein
MFATAAMLTIWLPQSTEMISRRGWSSRACSAATRGCWRRRSCCRSSRESENSAVSEPAKKAEPMSSSGQTLADEDVRGPSIVRRAPFSEARRRPFLPVPSRAARAFRNRRSASPASLGDACCAAVLGERENAALYDRLIGAVDAYPDVQRTLRNLRAASQDNHLPAFERCVEREARGGEGRRGKGAGGGRGGPGGHRRGHGA